MESGLPVQRNCLVHPNPQILEIFKLGKITFGLGQTNIVF